MQGKICYQTKREMDFQQHDVDLIIINEDVML